MSELKVMVCDDQPGMRLVLRKLIEKAEGFRLVGEAESGEACLELFAELRPEIVFMDVEMPGINGVECARRIQDIDPKTALIFATAHEGYMGEAFELYAFDYLLKPFKAERVLATLNRLRELLRRPLQEEPVKPAPAIPRKKKRMLLRNKEGVSMVDMEDIILVQRENRATVLYTQQASYQTGDTLAEIEARLDPELFFRSHKSYIINLSYIDSITPYGRWTYVVKFKGIRQDALVTHEKYEQLEEGFG